MAFHFTHPYTIDPKYKQKVAYFCMEFGIHQPLKTYAGGLGFLAGSHMRSAYELKQNMVGIGVLWKYGYYDQVRKQDQTMDVLFQEKVYGFLQKTEIKFTITVYGHDVWVTAFHLPPEIFRTAPVFFLSTDIPDNDYLARTISHKLYDANPEAKIAAAILLGEGGAKLLEQLQWIPDVYHLNESHALPLAFYLFNRHKSMERLKKQLVFTNHTPEEAGNQKSNISLLEKMGFFCGIPMPEIKAIIPSEWSELDYTLTALRLAGKANGVSKLHQKTMCRLWGTHKGIDNISFITNAQNFNYWHDPDLYQALSLNDDAVLRNTKQKRKQTLFELVADQCGEIYDESVFTLVFAKRFAGYKRADLLLHDMNRFEQLVTNTQTPVQIIWAGKPYPMDYTAIGVFDKITDISKKYSNCAILAGYEMSLSKILKQGSDAWLNVPRLTHEASGTSGMAAAMNGSVNIGLPDGWFPEFAAHNINSFVITPCNPALPDHLQDEADAAALYDLLEQQVLPTYYHNPEQWTTIMKNSMKDIIPQYDSNRMAKQYYELLYTT